MKEPITQIIALLSGLLIAIAFIIHWYKKYDKLFSSISRTAYYLNKEGKVLQFTAFIFCLSASVMIGGQSSLSAIAGGMLSIIGIATGYNPNIVNNKWENRLHVIFVEIPFIIFLTDFIRIGARAYICGNEYIFWFYIALEAIFFAYLGIILLFEIKNHTTIIEYGMIITIVTGYLFNAITK